MRDGLSLEGRRRIAPSSLAASILLVLVLAGCPGMAQVPGQQGSPCWAVSDCAPPLTCVQGICAPSAPRGPCRVDGDCTGGHVCLQGLCTPVRAGTPTTEPGPAPSTWAGMRLEGVHGFLGITLAPGTTGWWWYGSSPDFGPSFFFALKGGVYLEKVELALEISPLSWLSDPDLSTNFSLLSSIGGLLPIAERVYWPLRFGIGMSAVNLPLDSVFMQGRLDILGICYQHGHLLFEVSLPSIRFHTEFSELGIWSGLFNISVAYVL